MMHIARSLGEERLEMNMPNQQLLTVYEFAKTLNVTPACIRRWIMERKVVTIKLGRLVRIPPDEVERIIQSGLRPVKRDKDETSNG